MQVGLGKGSPATCSVNIHLHAHAGTAILVILVLGIGDYVTLQRCTAVALCHADSIKFVPVGTLALAHALDTPLELNVRGKDVLGFGSCEQFADSLHVALVCKTYYTAISTLGQLQLAQQGMLLLQALQLGVAYVGIAGAVLGNSRCQVGLLFGRICSGNLIGLFGRSGFLVNVEDGSQLAVYLYQERSDFLRVVGLPELQVGRTLQQLADALGLLHTRHFHHDAAFLAFQSLDVGLYHTEAVDTGAQNVVAIVNSTLQFGTQNVLNFLVCALGRNLVAKLLCGKQFGEGTLGSHLLEVFNEQGNKVTLAFGCFLSRLLHGIAEGLVGVFLVVSQSLDYIGHADFEDYIHTALEVKTQADTHFAALLQVP